MDGRDSLLAMLDALDAALPPALFPGAARQKLRTLCAPLPFIPCVGFECHLGATPARVDLLAYTGERDLLRSLLKRTPLDRVVRAGGESQALLENWVDAVLFEFDLDDSSRLRPPAVFLNFKPEAVVDGASLTGLGACLVGRLSKNAARLLHQCAEAATGFGAQVTHLGSMNSRGNKPLRVNIGATDAGILRGFVEAVGWESERRTRVDAMLELAGTSAHHFVLAFDFAGRLQPRVGLECYMASAPGYSEHWSRFLARLNDAGLCAESEAAALLAWPGLTAVAEESAFTPGQARLADFLGAHHPASILRTLNHVKLVSAPGEPTHAKAYLVATQAWHDFEI